MENLIKTFILGVLWGVCFVILVACASFIMSLINPNPANPFSKVDKTSSKFTQRFKLTDSPDGRIWWLLYKDGKLIEKAPVLLEIEENAGYPHSRSYKIIQ